MASILVVDDHRDNRLFLVKLLGYAGHRLLQAGDGAEALHLCRAERPDLVISDILMPTMDGFEFVRQLRNDPRVAQTVVIFYTATYHQHEALTLAQACGVVFLLQKPSKPDLILRTVAEALKLPATAPALPPDFAKQHMTLLTDTLTEKVEELEALNRQLAEAYDATLEGWVRALDLRDKETEGHTLRVTALALQLARVLDTAEEELPHIRRGALLHDIGKIGIPDRILLKPGPLDSDEWEVMRRHPVYAYEMLAPISYLRPALDIPYCHHEKWDGTGYPRKLWRKDIPRPARMFAVVDVWDALTRDRPYRSAWPRERASDHLRQQAGKHFDAEVVEAFLGLVTSAAN